MAKVSIQKGLQPRMVIRQIDVQDDAFPSFLRWLQQKIENEDYMKESASEIIIQIVEKPHAWQKEWEEYHEQID